jgi:hypothetical protein
MDSDTLLDELETTRERLLVALEPLSDEALTQPETIGPWSVADVLAHLTAWESELVTALMRLKSGQKPARFLESTTDIEGFNARVYEENSGRDLDRIFADFHGVRVQLERWLDNFSDQELNDPQRFRWLKGQPLLKIIKQCSCGHELEHLPEIETYSRSLQQPEC